jgi:hypothetical protein
MKIYVIGVHNNVVQFLISKRNQQSKKYRFWLFQNPQRTAEVS